MNSAEIFTLDEIITFVEQLIKDGKIIASLDTCLSRVYEDMADNSANVIAKRFNLRRFALHRTLRDHNFDIMLGDQAAGFYAKYPKTLVRSSIFTLENLCEMLYELTIIKWALDENRFTLTELDNLSAGLGSQIAELIRCFNGHEDYFKKEKIINDLLAAHGLDANDILLDTPNFTDFPLSQVFFVIGSNYQCVSMINQ